MIQTIINEKDINFKMIAFLLFKTYHFLLEIFLYENKKCYWKFKDGYKWTNNKFYERTQYDRLIVH